MFQPPRIQVSVIRHRNTRLLVTPPQLARPESATPTCRATCRESFRQYLLNTTLHGLKYVGDGTITLFERWGKYPKSANSLRVFSWSKFYALWRIFFGLMFFVVVLLSAYFISNVYVKYQAKPMIISLDSKSTDIRSLPFPGKYHKYPLHESSTLHWITSNLNFIYKIY